MSCDPPKRDNSKHKLLLKNASSLVTIMNNIYYLYPAFSMFCIHYVNVSVLIKNSQKTSVFTLIIISSP